MDKRVPSPSPTIFIPTASSLRLVFPVISGRVRDRRTARRAFLQTACRRSGGAISRPEARRQKECQAAPNPVFRAQTTKGTAGDHQACCRQSRRTAPPAAVTSSSCVTSPPRPHTLWINRHRACAWRCCGEFQEVVSTRLRYVAGVFGVTRGRFELRSKKLRERRQL